MKTLRLILGDQLNQQHSWYSKTDSDVTYVMAEMRQETDYVKHHIQKVVAFFLSMRNFADFLKSTDKHNSQELTALLSEIIKKEKIEKFEYQLPDEYRLDLQLPFFAKSLKSNQKLLIQNISTVAEWKLRISLKERNHF